MFGRQCRKSFNKVEYTLTKVFTIFIDNESNMLKAFCILVMIKERHQDEHTGDMEKDDEEDEEEESDVETNMM